jgi:hypothetical protein
MTLLTSNCAASRRYTDPGGAAELRVTAKRCRQAPRPQRSARLGAHQFQRRLRLASEPPKQGFQPCEICAPCSSVPLKLRFGTDSAMLRAPSEEVCQRGAPLVGLESILLVDPNPRQLLPPRRQLVATPRQLLLGPEQLQPDPHGGMESQGT